MVALQKTDVFTGGRRFVSTSLCSVTLFLTQRALAEVDAKLSPDFDNPALPNTFHHDKEMNLFVFWAEFHKDPSHWNHLCFQSILRNRGSFRVYLVTLQNYKEFLGSEDLKAPEFYNVSKYPRPNTLKDLILFMAVTRYGGIALDLLVLFPNRLDRMWDAMVKRGQDSMFYLYWWALESELGTQNGQLTRVWAVMARRQSKIMEKWREAALQVKHEGKIEDMYIFGARIFDPILFEIYHLKPDAILPYEKVKFVTEPPLPCEFFNFTEKAWEETKELNACSRSQEYGDPRMFGVKLFFAGALLGEKSRDELLDLKTPYGKLFHFAGFRRNQDVLDYNICDGEAGTSSGGFLIWYPWWAIILTALALLGICTAMMGVCMTTGIAAHERHLGRRLPRSSGQSRAVKRTDESTCGIEMPGKLITVS